MLHDCLLNGQADPLSLRLLLDLSHLAYPFGSSNQLGPLGVQKAPQRGWLNCCNQVKVRNPRNRSVKKEYKVQGCYIQQIKMQNLWEYLYFKSIHCSCEIQLIWVFCISSGNSVKCHCTWTKLMLKKWPWSLVGIFWEELNGKSVCELTEIKRTCSSHRDWLIQGQPILKKRLCTWSDQGDRPFLCPCLFCDGNRW